MTKRKERVRALALQDNKIGITRSALYKEAYRRINSAITEGFHLEAIALVESLLADRLESRASFVQGKDYSFKTLDALIRKMEKIEPDRELRELIVGPVRLWKNDRNKALHEMVKLADNDSRSWNTRMKQVAPAARVGLQVLRAVDRRANTIKKRDELKRRD